MSKVKVISLERDEGCEITAKLEIDFVYSVAENSITDIKKELEEVVSKYSI